MPTEIKSNLIQNDTIELLRKFKILNNFTKQEIRDLLGGEPGRYQQRIAKLVRYEPQETVLTEGEFDSWVFWIVKGEFAVMKSGVPIAVFSRPGDVFGEMSILDADSRSATVVSKSGGVCLSIDMSILDTIRDAHIREKVRDGIQHLKSERLSQTTAMLVEEKRRVRLQKQEIQAEMKRIRDWEIRLRAMEKELAEKEKQLQAREKDLAARSGEPRAGDGR